MKASPLLFSTPMVIALLEGRKTQTRRALKVQPLDILPMKGDKTGIEWVGLMQREPEPKGLVFRCKYGKPGDLIWAKETFYAWGRWETRFSAKKGRDEWHFIDMTQECGKAYRYVAGMGNNGRHARHGGVTPAWWKRPAIFMPKAASRLTLRITDVRVDRLQEISEADARAEGVTKSLSASHDEAWSAADGLIGASPQAAYALLWQSINGPDSWAANPWVWAITFEAIQKNVDAVPKDAF